MLAAVIAAAFVVMGATAVRTASAKEPAVELAAGTVIYDSTCTPIQLTESTLVSRENGVYFLKQSDADIPLGAHTLAYDGSGVRVFGGGYRIDADGSICSVTDQDSFSDIHNRGDAMDISWAVDENGKDTSDAKRVIDNRKL